MVTVENVMRIAAMMKMPMVVTTPMLVLLLVLAVLVQVLLAPAGSASPRAGRGQTRGDPAGAQGLLGGMAAAKPLPSLRLRVPWQSGKWLQP